VILLRKLSHDVPALFGLGVILCAILIALFADQLAPYPGDAYESHVIQRLKPPSWDFPLGTDGQGRDILSRLILGTRGALLAAFAVVGATTLIGVPLGLVAGYYGGWTRRADHARSPTPSWRCPSSCSRWCWRSCCRPACRAR